LNEIFLLLRLGNQGVVLTTTIPTPLVSTEMISIDLFSGDKLKNMLLFLFLLWQNVINTI
jgi:hypothetical protein